MVLYERGQYQRDVQVRRWNHTISDRLFAVVRSAVLLPGIQTLAGASCPDVIMCIDASTNNRFIFWMRGGHTDGGASTIIPRMVGAIYATVGLAMQMNDPYKDRSELLAMIAMYLLVGKTSVDLLTKVKDLLETAHRIFVRPPRNDEDDLPLVQNVNLTERLLETIQEDKVGQHMARQAGEEEEEEQRTARRGSSSTLLVVPEKQKGPTVALSRHPSMLLQIRPPPKSPRRWELDWDPPDFISLDLPCRQPDVEEGELLRHCYRVMPKDEALNECGVPALNHLLHFLEKNRSK
jgi:hypothetical protein